jgi:hypothetical protein
MKMKTEYYFALAGVIIGALGMYLINQPEKTSGLVSSNDGKRRRIRIKQECEADCRANYAAGTDERANCIAGCSAVIVN